MSALDQLFFNGNVLTMDGPARAEAVGVRQGSIIAVGKTADLLPLADSSAERIDLAGRTLLPGFEDAHAHIWKIGQLLTSTIDLRPARSIEDLLALLRERARVLPPDAWLLGRGFNELLLRERRRPSRADLDRVADAVGADRPIVLTRLCGHILSANTAALRRAGIDRATPAPYGGHIEHDASGEPSGLLHETAMDLMHRVLPAPSRDEYKRMIHAATRHQLSLGVTSSSDCGVTPAILDAYLEMARQGTLPIRMNVMPLGPTTASSPPLPARHLSPMLRVDTLKFLADGGLSGATASLSVPYRNSTSCGVPRLLTGDLLTHSAAGLRDGWSVAVHAIGDAAIEEVTCFFEALPPHAMPRRPRIEHVGLPSRRQLHRMAQAGIVAVTQPIFLDELGDNFLAVIPDALADRIYPFGTMLAEGVTTVFSSDAPVVENDSPLAGIRAAAIRRTREGSAVLAHESVSIEAGLHAYTSVAADASGDDHLRGRIRPGCLADFVVLSDDPLRLSPASLEDITVEQTYVGGALAYQRTGHPHESETPWT